MKMYWGVLAIAAWGVFLASMGAHAFTLVTEDEVRTEARAAEKQPARRRALPAVGAPRIEVRAPRLSGSALRNPLRIELGFTSGADAEINPASFRAFYGSLRIDITERIVKSVRVTTSGLNVDNAEIPPGSHRLFLRIADTKQRATETELRFVIE